ncbi:alpha/beta fold hydrolase [Micromonospora polyrhachis]|uniref:Pimeloyl-ACP methyl ester carboxylesterase n=1 Tax=Micromonospora polyrhachis TaxID=1282883 RepID=A0A7W7WRP0_9ACTN|nr:alpha/beta fold hydrolase [Micromonospora polyrhachis]MBB4960767.1 pimeloyl-ACP methyl ester carboxylesterase [Micromonospora polyrhachis]
MTLRYIRPGQVCVEHLLEVPLDHDDPDGPLIELFAREVVAQQNADNRDLPWLLFLQGGPGSAADRPSSSSAWLHQALRNYRVLLLDQRGTGRSTPLNRQSLAGRTDAEAAAYLRHFRADAIVQDAELIRRQLLGDRPWSLLGQSFGGFCAMTYLSSAPQGLAEVMIAGGLPSLTAHPDQVYRAAYPRALAHTERFYTRYPGDRKVVRQVVDHLADNDIRLPSGERLSTERFQMSGLTFGMASGFDNLHHLLELAFISAPGGPVLSDTFLRGVDRMVSMAGQPLYALLHESIYCQGTASSWSASRVRAEFDEFDLWHRAEVNFTAEMFYPWLFDQDPALRPLRGCADLLAAHDDWPRLYDPDRLAGNTVPVAAVVYFDDLYVDFAQSMVTAGQVRGLRPWVTNEHVHDGLSARPAVFDRLRAMVRGEV